ncbi:MAG: Gfo/Idh/MocA family oxidoreductase [Planctomycetaceae bacterium]|nr:Gfo/Idh/MocA family oxidoreductase [Planctomycetaceae bacterium]
MPEIPSLDRRAFLSTSTQAGLGLALAATQSARATSANDKIVLGLIGLRGRGSVLGPDFAKRDDCEVAYLADVDTRWSAERVPGVESAQGRAPQTVQDFRRILDDKSVDAIIVATPDHWHALATVWGCQAGKDVYVEKPVSHSPWEGRKMVEAARKYQRVVQAGLQNRSAPYNHSAKAYIDSGKLGTIHLVKVFNQKSWPNVKAQPDGAAPATLDYDMWTGPAPESPYNVNYVNTWNHFWRFSGGDIINDGVHQMDLARWLVGVDYPKTAYSVGGRFAEEGVLESPDTQVSVFEFDKLTFVFELSLYTPYMIKSDSEVRNRADLYPYWPQNAERIEIYGSEGLMYVGRHGCGWQVYGRQHQRQPVLVAQEHGTFPDPEHKQNFCDSIRSRALPSADIEQGRRSTLMCQLANISYRLGGEKLTFDAATENCVGNDAANRLLKREYRSPWVVPERV